MGLAAAARVRAHAQAMAPLRRCVCPRQAVSTKLGEAQIRGFACHVEALPLFWRMGTR